MDKVKNLIAAGSSVPGAIKEALGMTVSDFADRHGLPRSATSEVINLLRRPTDSQVEALCAELGGTPDEWRLFLWEAARPQPATA